MFNRINFFLLFSAVLLVYFLTLGINLPYVGPNATNFNTYSLIAKNYNHFGFIQTKFAPIVSVANSLPDNPEYYLHHPQLLSVLESLFFKYLGEDFWVGRVVVIIFAFFSWSLIYEIAKVIKGKKFASIVALVSAFIPAFSIFGRMIGQESLVLFFGLLFLFSLLKYLNTKNKVYILLISLSIIFGFLSDWPMVYFVLSFIPLLILKKKIKLIYLIILLTLSVSMFFIAYVYVVSSGLTELTSAFLNRSLGILTTQNFWLIKWFLIILLRLFIYFNPLFIVFSFYYLFNTIFKFKKNNSLESLVIFGFFMFGLIHILLYPEGSFGHPYWTYYFVPFISLSASFMLFKIYEKRKFVFLLLIFLGSLIYLIKIEDWKIKEVQANIWRYELAKNVNKYFKPYELVLINSNSLINPDTLKYSFNHPIKVINEAYVDQKGSSKYLLYSPLSDVAYSHLTSKYEYESVLIDSSQGQVGIFFLNKPRLTLENNDSQDKKEQIKTSLYPYNENIMKKIYIFFKEFLNAPQI